MTKAKQREAIELLVRLWQDQYKVQGGIIIEEVNNSNGSAVSDVS